MKPHLNHSFQKVRERLGSIFINIFESDLNFVGAPEPECPRIKDIMREIVGMIKVLQQENLPIDKKSAEGSGEVDNSEYQQAVRVFKTGNFGRDC